MGSINTYTLKQYKECYSDLLERHKLEYEDHNEFTFINTELESFYEGFFDIEQMKISNELTQKLYSKTVFSESLIIELNSSRNDFMDAVKKSNLSSSMIIDFLEQRKQELEKKSKFETNSPQQPLAVKPDEVYKTQNLFKVGKLFATGEMNKYFTIRGNNEMASKNGLSPLKIAKELGNPSFEKWILASKNNYKNGENRVKNIFNNLDMMTKIISDCEAKNIPVDPYFISRLPIE